MPMAKQVPHSKHHQQSERPADGIAIGVMAYNEEGNIGNLLTGMLHQSVDRQIERIVVMASGCTDRTCEIVAEYAKTDARIELVAEAERKGKVHAINRFLTMVRQPLCIITSADLGFNPTTVERITEPFADPGVGVVGAHAVP